MTKRIFASLAFLAGGVVFWWVLSNLLAFSASMAGMSSGINHGPAPFIDALIPWLVLAYFLISGIGLFAYRKERDLRAVGLTVHLLLLIAFLGICSEGLDQGVAKFLQETLVLGALTVFCFSPWFVIWYAFLFMRSDGTPPRG